MIDLCFDVCIEKAIQKKIIKQLPASPKQKIEFIRTYFKKYKTLQEVVPIYIFFKRVPDLQKTREGEFRKNVNLKVIDCNEIVSINLEKLNEYASLLERFIRDVRLFLSA
jgi:hypothetical protein